MREHIAQDEATSTDFGGVDDGESEVEERARKLPSASCPEIAPVLGTVAVVGRGRVGSCFSRILRDRCVRVVGPLGRDVTPDELATADSVLLCVPDRSIESAARMVPARTLVGHCSGASALAVLGHHRGFSVHPLMTITGSEDEALTGAAAAIAGSDPQSRRYARTLAQVLGMKPFSVSEGDRIAYHAAASVASNLIMPLLQLTEELATSAGVPRDAFSPLVGQALANWAQRGATYALTGPVARGDTSTVRAQRAAVQERAPDRLWLFDALVTATKSLASAVPSS